MNLTTPSVRHLCLIALLVAAVAHHSEAVSANGTFAFAGTGSGMQMGGTSTLTFNNPMIFTFGSGDFSGLSGTPAAFAPISWTGTGMSATLVSSGSPEWTIVSGGTTYQFSLLSLTSASMDPSQVFLVGLGVVTLSGAIVRDPTPYSLLLSGSTSINSYAISLLGVPEPKTVAFLVFGGAALVIWRRRRSQRI
jgi:hypothetical protein